LLTLSGCSFKLVPVSGTVTGPDGKPLTGVGVIFSPDESKGNSRHVAAWSRLNGQGQYNLATMSVKGSDPNGPGAPLGWFKVTLLDNLPGMSPLPKSIDHKYTDEKKTPLEVEVVENPAPGAYDFKITK
jgi:hypothetical protein